MFFDRFKALNYYRHNMSKVLMRELRQVNVKKFSNIYHGNIFLMPKKIE